MNKLLPRRLHIATVISALLFCTVVLVNRGCSYADSTTQNGAGRISSPTTFNQQVIEKELRPLDNPGPLTLTELQTNLASSQSDSAISAIGGYPLGYGETMALSSILGAFEEKDFHVSAVMMDLTTGYGVSCNVNEVFYSASSIKGPYVACIAATYPESIEYSFNLMYASISYSDNDAYFSLRSSYGHDPFIEWSAEAGIDSSISGEWFPYYSARDLAQLWLLNYEYFESENEGVDEAASWFVSTYNSAITLNLGSSYSVLSKGGWISDEVYASTVDAGIVYADDSPYLMVVMTDVPSDISSLGPLVLALNEIHENMWERTE